MHEVTVFSRHSASYARLEQRLEKLSHQTKITIKLYDLADHSRLQKEIMTSDLLVNATPVKGCLAKQCRSLLQFFCPRNSGGRHDLQGP